ncbi:MAG TPA: hypothetical protein VHJ17_23170, partial [Thermomonospora sp.]|nr:hypothetical protein [Thermomonospora sp.]
MIRNSRRVFAFTVAGAVAFAPVVSACGAGHTPQTAMPTQLTEGVNASVPEGAKRSEIDIRNLFVLGPKPGATAAPGEAVPLYGTLINQVPGRTDRLVGVSSPAFGQAKIAGGAIVLPPSRPGAGGQAVSLSSAPGAQQPGAQQPGAQPTGGQSPQAGRSPRAGETPQGEESPRAGQGGQGGQTAAPEAALPPVTLQGLTSPLIGGETISLTLRFEKAGSITLAVPVVPLQGEYGSYSPVPTTPTEPAQPAQPG